ncbi:NUDIX domain-containing protein [Spiractinospora alimapuensis]|uniref:NUDIX hydrolase n=1 Tax=Spiractinospora alimapuensis TaxID=2820884 RepID=UPI001F2E5BB3|nr:NUDIX domain-containing protein [Spiractinospora alimapuensis]QVQ53618.1 NUDIX domain-containing protein [Spiractinospora alimapuensis]
MTTIDKIAWIHLRDGRVLAVRSRGKDVFYLPGGKREPGESDLETLVREIREELGVAILPATAEHLGTFHAQAHGHADDVTVRVTCYTAECQGTPTPNAEIAETAWLDRRHRERVSPVNRVVLDHLWERGRLA